MNKIDVCISLYGKPYNTIATIESLMRVSGQHIDKIYLTKEKKQPWNDWAGIYKIIDTFRNKTFNNEPINLVVYQPKYFIPVGFADYDLALNNTAVRQSIMFQYALENTDKPYLCVLHNDMLFHKDILGEMLLKFDENKSLMGVGSVGQC